MQGTAVIIVSPGIMQGTVDNFLYNTYNAQWNSNWFIYQGKAIHYYFEKAETSLFNLRLCRQK